MPQAGYSRLPTGEEEKWLREKLGAIKRITGYVGGRIARYAACRCGTRADRSLASQVKAINARVPLQVVSYILWTLFACVKRGAFAGRGSRGKPYSCKLVDRRVWRC